MIDLFLTKRSDLSYVQPIVGFLTFTMTQYILLIHGNTTTTPSGEDWDRFFEAASQSGLFRGGSEIGERLIVGNPEVSESTDHIAGFMRFDSDDITRVLDLLEQHPTVLHGGSVELCEMPRSGSAKAE